MCSIVSESFSPMDCSPPGISQARILEWIAISSGIFPTQGSNPHLLCLLLGGWILYHWEACSFFQCDEIGPKWLIQAISTSQHPSPLSHLQCLFYTGVPCFIAFPFIVFCRYFFFKRSRSCDHPSVSKSRGTIFPTAFVTSQFFSQCFRLFHCCSTCSVAL